MGLLGKLKKAHLSLVEDQRILIAAEIHAQRRGDTAVASRHGEELHRIARDMRAVETMINDETGQEYYVV